uniref:ZP domain-containing protein n=1 Tax=Panagrellus redivivus TaxID=6233 RepID=A0A7E4ZZN9_PANRE
MSESISTYDWRSKVGPTLSPCGGSTSLPFADDPGYDASLDKVISSRLSDQFSELIKSKVSVTVDELDITYVSNNATYPNPEPQCKLTLHRNLCTHVVIGVNETINWNTRICFKWTCTNAPHYAMRVENCWTGSVHNPVYLIDEHGCSLEQTMVRTPNYETHLLQGYSVGWLSVRLVGVQRLKLSCSIRMCHICDKKCKSITPPQNCEDDTENMNAGNIWNNTRRIDNICNPPTLPPITYTRKPKSQRSKAAASVDYAESGLLVDPRRSRFLAPTGHRPRGSSNSVVRAVRSQLVQGTKSFSWHSTAQCVDPSAHFAPPSRWRFGLNLFAFDADKQRGVYFEVTLSSPSHPDSRCSSMLCGVKLLLAVAVILTGSASVTALFPGAQPDEGDYRHLYPLVCLSVHIEDHAHSLPYSMGLIENLRYPKDRLHFTFVAEENVEETTLSLAKTWTNQMTKIYRTATVLEDRVNWREVSLQWARAKSCDYALISSADDFLMSNTIKKLIDLKFVAVSPLLNGPFNGFSNVHGLLDKFYYERTKVGSQQAYYINTPVFIHLKAIDSTYLTFDSNNLRDYAGSEDPIQIFAHSAYSMQIPLFIDNREFYGYLLSSKHYSINHHKKLLGYFLANLVSDSGPMPFPHSTALEPWYPEATTLSFDQIYVVNLKRRPERLQKMDLIMRLLGIEYRVFEAVDGLKLTDEQIASLRFLPGYEDPYYKRPMKAGEIGCFLSHYGVWQDVVRNGYDRVVVFEDDVRFSENSTIQLRKVVEDIMKTRLDWDLIYLGRKKMTPHGDEFYIPGHRYLSTLAYSYWTLGYALSNSGARKLIAAKPLEKLLALDEFLPIMYGQHPNNQWASYFEPRDVKGFATYPVIVTPERYTNDEGYISDTEASSIVNLGNLARENKSQFITNEADVQSKLRATSTMTKTEL